MAIAGTQKRILIFYTDAGGGHRAAALGLQEAFRASYGERYDVRLVDGAPAGMWPVRIAPRLYFPVVTRLPWLWNIFFHATNTRWGGAILDALIAFTMRRGMGRVFQEQQPDLIVSVHHQAARAARAGLDYLGMRCPIATVVLDLRDAHVSWYSTRADLLIVPTEDSKQRALNFGFPEERIRTIGWPIGEKFSEFDKANGAATQSQTRAQLGMLPDRFTVLVSGGGEGFGPLDDLIGALAEAHLPIQIAAITGRNAALKQRIEGRDWGVPVFATGFVTNMPEWMRASNVLITKAGPATIMEAFACGLPLILNGYIPGLEFPNVRFVEEIGAGVFRRDPSDITTQMREWLEPGNRDLARMSERAHANARPRAAREIVAELAKMIDAGGQDSNG